jgi:hypothetical protein
MRFFTLLTLLFVVFAAFPAPAHAGFWKDLKCWFIICTGSGDEVFTRPELEDGKTPHNIQFADDPWTPQEWIDSRGSVSAVVDGFYKAGIVTNQSRHWRTGVPILEVGQGFMRLSGQEKRRVAKFMDYTFENTEGYGGTYLLRHAASGDSIGVYNTEGLQLQ